MKGDFTGGIADAVSVKSAAGRSKVEITVGPFAGGHEQPVVYSGEQRPARQRFHADDSRSELAKTADIAPGGGNTPTHVDPQSIVGGTNVVMGSDVGQLPGAVTDAAKPAAGVSAKGQRGPPPAPDAKAVAAGIILAMRGRKSAPAKPRSSPMPTAVQPAGTAPSAGDDGRDAGSQDRVTMALPPASGDMDRRKTAMAAIGLPAALVAAGSIVDQAVWAKLAEVDAADPGDHAAAYVTRDDVHPMALWTMLCTRYDQDWLTWDLEVVKATLAADLGREPRDSVMNKIAAMQMLTRQPVEFYKDWHVFEKLCLAFDGQAPRLTLIEELSPEQMALGVSVARMVAKPDEFDAGLKKYCAVRLFDAGLMAAPPELGFCDAQLQTMIPGDQQPLRQAGLDVYTQALAGKETRPTAEDDPAFIQAARLLRIHAYVLDKIDDLVRQTS